MGKFADHHQHTNTRAHGYGSARYQCPQHEPEIYFPLHEKCRGFRSRCNTPKYAFLDFGIESSGSVEVPDAKRQVGMGSLIKHTTKEGKARGAGYNFKCNLLPI